MQALIYDLTDPREADAHLDDWTVFRKPIKPNDKAPVKLHITSLKAGNYHLAVFRTGFEENDAYSQYLKMGTPPQLDAQQIQQLKALASGKPSSEEDVTIGVDGQWEREFPMRDNEVVFATLTPK